MKVIKSEEDYLEFDNGLQITSWHTHDCCECNYLDFEQFQKGDEFDDCNSVGDFLNAITIKEDGFIMKDKLGIPKWAQARSSQNGYYSNRVGLEVFIKDECYKSEKEIFDGQEDIY